MIKKKFFIKKGSRIVRNFYMKKNNKVGSYYTLNRSALKGIANESLYKTIDTYP